MSVSGGGRKSSSPKKSASAASKNPYWFNPRKSGITRRTYKREVVVTELVRVHPIGQKSGSIISVEVGVDWGAKGRPRSRSHRMSPRKMASGSIQSLRK